MFLFHFVTNKHLLQNDSYFYFAVYIMLRTFAPRKQNDSIFFTFHSKKKAKLSQTRNK